MLETWGVDMLLGSMRSIHFDVQGFSRTYWDLFVAAGFSVGVLYHSLDGMHAGKHSLFQLPNPLLQELPLWFLLGQRQSFLIRRPSLSCPAKPAVHIRTG